MVDKIQVLHVAKSINRELTDFEVDWITKNYSSYVPMYPNDFYTTVLQAMMEHLVTHKQEFIKYGKDFFNQVIRKKYL